MAQRDRPSRPGQEQRRRCTLAWGLLVLVWGGRWIWPLLWLPGWMVGLVALWAVVELAVLLLAPRRWR